MNGTCCQAARWWLFPLACCSDAPVRSCNCLLGEHHYALGMSATKYPRKFIWNVLKDVGNTSKSVSGDSIASMLANSLLC